METDSVEQLIERAIIALRSKDKESADERVYIFFWNDFSAVPIYENRHVMSLILFIFLDRQVKWRAWWRFRVLGR